ncbi:hypothetical protein EBR57_07220 [bacterium]|nr:hypothetical protein [bacterium]
MKLRLFFATMIGAVLSFISVACANDVEVRLHETVLNTVIQVLAPMKGEGDFDGPFGKRHYTWILKNPRLSVQPEGLAFIADTSVNVAGIPYDTTAKGRASAKINDKTGKIDIKVAQASFGLEFNVFGNRIHVTDIDVSGAVGKPFTVDVPTINQIVTIPAEGDRPAKVLRLQAATPNISFSPPFLVVGAPLIIK